MAETTNEKINDRIINSNIELETCSGCGRQVPVQAFDNHHIDGRKHSNRIIRICRVCHFMESCTMVLLDCEEIRSAQNEINALLEIRYVGWLEKLEIMLKHGYNPATQDKKNMLKAMAEWKVKS